MRSSSFFSLKVFSRQKRLIYLCLFLFATAVFLSYLFMGKDFRVLKYPDIKNEKATEKTQMDDILGRALNVSMANFDLSFSNLENQIEATILDARPDDSKNTKYLELRLGSESNIIAFGEKVFLRYFSEIGYEFSCEPTDIWLIPSYKDKVNVKIFANYVINGQTIKKAEEIKIKIIEKESEVKDSDEFSLLKEAKWIGPDKYEELFGDKKNFKQRLIINGSIFEVSKEDLLIYKDGKWQTNVLSENYPLAQFKVLSANSLELYFWPKDSLKKQRILLNPAATSQSLTLSDDFITDIHLRSLRYVSCKLEKQRIIMKEKDLLLKKDGKWKIVKADQLKNEKLGDFLVFDSIENNKMVKMFKGYLFNKDRTQVVKIQKEIIHRKESTRKKKIIR